MMRRFGVLLIAMFAVVIGGCGGDAMPSNDRLLSAFSEGRTGVWVSGHGVVVRGLSSDENSQRFLVRVDDELSLVVRHSTEASGVVPIERGDRIAFQGRYEFHGGGGEILFTHADPDQPGGGGWILHDGNRYD